MSDSLRSALLDGTPKASGAFAWLRGRARGYTLATLAVLAVAPDAMLLRFIRQNAPLAEQSTVSQIAVILAIKYTMMGIIQLVFVLYTSSDSSRVLIAKARKSWRAVLPPLLCMLVTQIGFTIGLLETTAANAIMYFSLNPMWAAVMGLAFLGDEVRKHTLVAMGIALLAVAMAFAPSLLGPSGEGGHAQEEVTPEGASAPTLHGNLVALATGVSLAAFITSSRAGSLGDEDAPMGLAPALGSLGAALVATPLAVVACGGSAAPVLTRPLFLAYLLADAVLEAFYDLWMGMAAEDITSAEVALVLLLEIPLGPLYVFLAFREVPAVYTIAGAAVLLVTLVGHGVIEARTASDSRRSSPNLSRADSLTALPAGVGAVRRLHSWSSDLTGVGAMPSPVLRRQEGGGEAAAGAIQSAVAVSLGELKNDR